jgi:parvulin-like peptidyl-prolyl isomerase
VIHTIAALLLASQASLFTHDAHAGTVDRVAAVVNDSVVVLSEVYELGGDFIEQRAVSGDDHVGLRRTAELEVLDSLIQRRLISQEIGRLGLDVTQLELDRTIDDIANRNGLEREALQAEVEKSGLPWSEYKEELRENLRQMKFNEAVIRPRILVDEDELLDAYKRLIASVERPKIADIGAVFLGVAADADDATRAAVMERAAAVKTRVDAGEDFAKVAAEVDEGPYGAQGGKMGEYRQGDLVGELDRAAFSLTTGQISGPVITPQGIFVLYAFDIDIEAAAAFDDVREQLFEQVYADRIEEEVDQWYNGARRQAAVLIKLESNDSPLVGVPQ